jgi:large subunit ribosomal protein L5
MQSLCTSTTINGYANYIHRATTSRPRAGDITHSNTKPRRESSEVRSLSLFQVKKAAITAQQVRFSRIQRHVLVLKHARYRFRSPRYDRGPMHPHQPLHPSDPASREFVPGPFSSPRVELAYHNIIAPDFMTMCYQHTPPGFRSLEKAPRLRSWVGNNPYFENRQLRGPRGGDVLRLLRKPITFRNVPMIERITVHAMVSGALKGGSGFLHVGGMILQTITNQRAVVHTARKNEQSWGLIRGRPVSLTVDLKGEDMYHFLGKLINVVLPRIKDWNGVRATTGDNSGNLSFGLNPEVVAGFPEIEINYDAYPTRMIPVRTVWTFGPLDL